MLQSPLLHTGKYYPRLRNQILPHTGPLKRDDNTLAVRDEEKANLMNTFFATVGAGLSRNSTCAPVEAEIDIAPIQTISDVQISENSISRKIKALKVNKAEGPDGITPKLLRLAEPAVVPSLTKLYSLSAKEGEVVSLWKQAHLCPVFKKMIQLTEVIIDLYRYSAYQVRF